jgi:hypothetical protein
MDALIDAQPEWADVAVFEQARENMLQHGLQRACHRMSFSISLTLM